MKKIILLIPLCAVMLAFSACDSENNTAENTVSESVFVSETTVDTSALETKINTETAAETKVETQDETTESTTENVTENTAEQNEAVLPAETTASAVTTAAAVAAASTTSAETEQPATTTETAFPKSIVVYFSCTGNTKAVAEIIAEKQGADIYEIVPEQPYTDEDLDYGNRSSRSTSEQNDDSSRPTISGSIDLSGYDTVYVGYPIWWADMPRIMYTFFDTYDLSGKTIAPFCTSGGSGLSGTPKTISELEPDANVTAGLHAGGSEKEVSDWLS